MSSQDPLALTQAYVRTTSRRPQPRVLAFATERDDRIPRGISACMIQKDAEIDDRSHVLTIMQMPVFLDHEKRLYGHERGPPALMTIRECILPSTRLRVRCAGLKTRP